MQQVMQFAAGTVLCFALIGYWDRAIAQQPIAPEAFNPAVCAQLNVDGRASAPLQAVALPPSQSCTTSIRNGFPVPDPNNCTPGATNPTLTIEVLRDRSFSTRCVRDVEVEKAATYDWYGLQPPSNNNGKVKFTNWTI
jgi:hypothetical protein